MKLKPDEPLSNVAFNCKLRLSAKAIPTYMLAQKLLVLFCDTPRNPVCVCTTAA